MTPTFIRPHRPRRDFRLPMLVFGVIGTCALIFTLVCVTVTARRYRDMTRYMQDMPCASANDAESNRPPCQSPAQAMTIVGASSYVETHRSRGGDISHTYYALQLRDAGGKIVTERRISESVGQAATVGKVVTAEYWRGKLTDISIDGHTSTTSDAPIETFFSGSLTTLGGFFVLMFCGGVISVLRKSQ